MVDRTRNAITRQLAAMGCDQYEVGIYHRADDKMIPRFFTYDQILKSIPWLRSKNISGCDIYVRPAGAKGLLFFDDFSQGMVKRLKEDGYHPALIVESSPQNFHGWIRVAAGDMEQDLATAACKYIAGIYGGDMNSADWRHYGRLCGFTNRKPAYVNGRGHSPFVLLTESKGVICERADEILNKGKIELVKKKARAIERRQMLDDIKVTDQEQSADECFIKILNSFKQHYGHALNTSNADWAIVNKMIELGYVESAIRSALLTHSEAVQKRPGREDQYINITLHNAYGRSLQRKTETP